MEGGLPTVPLPCPSNCEQDVQGSFTCCVYKTHPGHRSHEVIIFGHGIYLLHIIGGQGTRKMLKNPGES